MSETTWQTCSGAEYPFKGDRVTLTKDGTQVIDRVTLAELDDGDVILSTANARGDWGDGKFRIADDAWTLAKTERLDPDGAQPPTSDTIAEAARVLGQHPHYVVDHGEWGHAVCACGDPVGSFVSHRRSTAEFDIANDAHRAHQAAVLAAAGLLHDEDPCVHASESGDEGPVADLGRMPTRWRCDGCGRIRHEPGCRCDHCEPTVAYAAGGAVISRAIIRTGDGVPRREMRPTEVVTVHSEVTPPSDGEQGASS